MDHGDREGGPEPGPETRLDQRPEAVGEAGPVQDLNLVRRTVRLWRYEMPVPRSRLGRRVLGFGLIIVGTLGLAMPVIGLWMWGPGMLILSVDSHRARRLRRRVEVRAVRWLRRRRAHRRRRRRKP